MDARRWSGPLYAVGSIAVVVGTLDPLEGSVLILAGTAVVMGAVLLGRSPRREVVYWLWTLALIAIGVGVMFGFSAVGGFGGRTGRSMWWALTILPYPVGWFLAMRAIVLKIIARWKMRHAPA
jgi:hypothetical protein